LNHLRNSWLSIAALSISALVACGTGSDDPAGDTGGSSGTGASAGKGGAGGTGGAGGSSGKGGTTGGSSGKGGTTGGSGGATGGAGGTTGGSSGKGGTSGGSGGTTGGAGGTGGSTGGVGGNGGTGGTTGGSGGSASGSGGTGGSDACPGDTCPVAAGVTYECRRRFMYGLNYAWQNFAGDFGGGNRGIAATRNTINTTLQQMASNGVDVIRWWVWPNFTGNGVSFDGSGTPTGLTSTTLADLEALLSLAEQHDVYLMLTLFSFDNFKTMLPANRRMDTIARDANLRAGLVNNVVKPFARAATMSPNAHRVIAWDVINEPEWAISGQGMYGDDDAFDPTDDLSAISHAQMETLLEEVITGLRAESPALITVGAAAMKWKSAWSQLDQDFYQFHIYDWVQEYWPYTTSPAGYGLSDKPLVMGEFPPEGVSGASYRTMLDSWYSNGYAGALAWRDSNFRVDYAAVKSFADAHPCETSYSVP